MSAVLTTSAIVLCGHPPGTAQPLTSTAVLTVGTPGRAVLTEADLKRAPIVGCPLSPPASGNVGCQTILAITAGTSSTLLVNGAPVLLDTLAGDTSGTVGGTPQKLLSASDPLSVLATQGSAP